MSSLGINSKGEVRTASEFKDIFEESGQSFRPYKCPFCEVLYEDRCIVTECVKAPHFKLPEAKKHRDGCNGEVGEIQSIVANPQPATTKRIVVGKIEIPESLVSRRKSSVVRKPGDAGLGPPPDENEVVRRRRLIASDTTISSCYTTSLLRPVIKAYRRLKKHAHEQATADKLEKGSDAYNLKFRRILKDYDLSLYGQKLNYGNAFQGSKVMPYRLERIYNGTGKIRAEADCLVITDEELWPKQSKSKTELAPFEIKFSRTVGLGAPTSHIRAMEELEELALTRKNIEWHAYGLPALNEGRFEIFLDSLNNLYWNGQYKP